MKFQTENSKIGILDQNLTNLERSSASPYLSAGTAHSAGPSYFCRPGGPSLTFFRIFPDIGPIFFVSKNLEKTSSSRSPQNFKNMVFGWLMVSFWLLFGYILASFCWKKYMLKLVTEKIRKIIKNHVSLNSKIIEIHWKNNGFWWFRRLHVRMVKVWKNIENETNIHPKFNEKSIKIACCFKAVFWTSFFSFWGIFFKNGRFWAPLRNPMG